MLSCSLLLIGADHCKRMTNELAYEDLSVAKLTA